MVDTTLQEEIPGILKDRSKVERFFTQSQVCSQKLGDVTENTDFDYCLELMDLTPTFW